MSIKDTIDRQSSVPVVVNVKAFNSLIFFSYKAAFHSIENKPLSDNKDVFSSLHAG